MRSLMITLAGVSLAAVSATATAGSGCGYYKQGKMTMQPAVMTGYQQPGLVRTGGYGMTYADKKASMSKPDIVDTAAAAGAFTTLIKAAQAAGLVDTLKGDGPFTVFAPTDAAFAKLPAGTLDSLLADPDKLAQVLKYHVVAGKLDARKVTAMNEVLTVEGSSLPVSSIKIVDTDIMTSNGIIHVIDEVLVPQS